jgi:sugar lactone lactonase YvrE
LDPPAGDGDLAADVELQGIAQLNFDADGNLYFMERVGIRRVGAMDWRISTLAPGASWTGFAIDRALGRAYVSGNNSLQAVDLASGQVTQLLNNNPGPNPAGDGGPLSLATASAATDAVVHDGAVFVTGTYPGESEPPISSYTIRRFDIVNDVVTTVVGPIDPQGDGAFPQAHLGAPRGLTVGPNGSLLIADAGTGRIRAAELNEARLHTVVGYDNGRAPSAVARYRPRLQNPSGVAFEPSTGIAYITETATNLIQRVDTNTAQWTIAPTTSMSSAAGHVDGDLVTAVFDAPHGLALDAQHHRLYVTDSGSHTVRSIDLPDWGFDGYVGTIAGVPYNLGFDESTDSLAGQSLLFEPTGLATGADGSLFIADTGNNRVRRILPNADGVAGADSLIVTVLGDGTPRFPDDGPRARATTVESPHGLWVSSRGDLYVASRTAVTLLLADATGVVTGEGPVLGIYAGRDHATMPALVTTCITGIVGTDDDSLYVTDECAGAIVKLARNP